ncbi:imidazole glycerol phosphate synthase, glutamine amidotransferase subunit [Candidatus Peregrinibacteria bacterium RIFOXYB2_FULL_32_7]|nr:MAG: imidazole glycerol phosphate synthase, glutamine amidotransferase subunit [Candidatus Peregrinibacteria bacterium RIFOXYB2_FULL_32_7]
MITLIDYNSGNPTSVANALEKLGFEYKICSKKEEIAKADKIIFPGQGHNAQAMAELKKLDLIDVIKNFKKPFLGICVGMQLLYEFSEEGDTECLGVIEGRVKKMKNEKCKMKNEKLKIPQMGWNEIKLKIENEKCKMKDEKLRIKNLEFRILKNIPNHSYFYFVHSYFCSVNEYTLATCEYGNEFCAIVKKENFYGTQFHPEKSGEVGLELLKNFCLL